MRERSETWERLWERQEESLVTPLKGRESGSSPARAPELLDPVSGGRWGAAAGGWLHLCGWGKRALGLLLEKPSGRWPSRRAGEQPSFCLSLAEGPFLYRLAKWIATPDQLNPHGASLPDGTQVL